MPKPADMTPTQRVSAFAIDRTFDRLPDDVIHAVRRAILDSIGVSVAGTRHSASQKTIELVTGMGTGGPCHLIGSNCPVSPFDAALANGVTAHVLDWDDTILPTRAHLGAVLLPPLVAAAEIEGWTIGQILPAYAVGFEIQSRLNHAVYPSIHLRGWQGTGIVGGIGTAACLSRLLGLGADQVAHAIGIAATNASGLVATFGSMSKALNLGRAGASGLQSAYLARLGFTSNPDILGAGRFLEMYDDSPRHGIVTEKLGEQWSILENGYKPYPCGFVAHAMIDAVRDLRAKVGPDAQPKRLCLKVSPESTHLMGNPDPKNELEAKFSLLYEASVAWVDGNVTPAAFDEKTVRDPRYRSVMAITSIEATTDVAQHEAHAEGEFDSGRVERIHVRHARGTQARPMTDDDLREKFFAACNMGGINEAGELAALVMNGDKEPAGQLLSRLSALPSRCG
jgi:2-methylcitrate dehydratase PrpD